MSNRLRAPAPVIAARIGRTDLGEAAVVLEDDALCVSVRETPGERPLRIELASINGVSVVGNEVTLPLRGGTLLLLLVSESATEVCDAILDACRTLPELTSALRTFGSRRGNRSMRATAADEQRRFFAPMLRARREAGDALTPAAAIAAFDVAALVDSTHRAIHGFAEQRFADAGPARRALEAELFDANEPLDASYKRLRDAAANATSSIGELAVWRVWAAQLRVTFEVADRTWQLLDAVLEATPVPPPKQNAKSSNKQTTKP